MVPSFSSAQACIAPKVLLLWIQAQKCQIQITSMFWSPPWNTAGEASQKQNSSQILQLASKHLEVVILNL